MDTPYLLFEFRNAEGAIEPLLFKDPVRVLQTNLIEEVPSILAQLDKAAEHGFYSAGFVSYEAAPAFDAAMKVHSAGSMPLVWFGIFSEPQKPDFLNEQKLDAETGYQVSGWQMARSPEIYQQGIEEIKKAIEEGDTYQVNYTERLHADFTGNDYAFYRQLVRNQQASYSAYLKIGKQRILSASPELFFQVQNGQLITKPMKGTAPRGLTLEEDKVRIAELLASDKERAENLMIVDLLRNDMSRLAERGTVKVDALFEVETYPTVHQMTSTVKAALAPELTIVDWFNALFPCGSITGAPKISTMQTIADLESTPREVYCGAIGYMTPAKDAVFSVPIRTVVIDQDKGKAHYGVGGGVTWDSTSEGEFRELYTKAQVLTAHRPEFKLLESLKLEQGKYPLLNFHLKRLIDSAAYFSFQAEEQEIANRLFELAEELPESIYKVRLLLGSAGEISLEAQEITALKKPLKYAVAEKPVDSSNPFLYHKTTNREIYDKAAENLPSQAFSVLLWNEKEELTEFTIGNLVVEKAGEFFTPPVKCGLLAGTFRQKLLDAGDITEKTIRKHELGEYDAVWFINSVRGWLKMELLV